jgi:hypothetical protein
VLLGCAHCRHKRSIAALNMSGYLHRLWVGAGETELKTADDDLYVRCRLSRGARGSRACMCGRCGARRGWPASPRPAPPRTRSAAPAVGNGKREAGSCQAASAQQVRPASFNLPWRQPWRSSRALAATGRSVPRKMRRQVLPLMPWRLPAAGPVEQAAAKRQRADDANRCRSSPVLFRGRCC